MGESFAVLPRMERVELSLIDRSQVAHFVHFLFVYQKNEIEFDQILQELRRGANALAVRFPILRGTVRRNDEDNSNSSPALTFHHVAICNTEEILIEVTEKNQTLKECGFDCQETRQTIESMNDWPRDLNMDHDENPLLVFTLKVTRFACGGVSIVARFHHQVLDGYAAQLVLRYLSDSINHTPPSISDVPCTTDDRDQFFLPVAQQEDIEPSNVTKDFVTLTPDQLASVMGGDENGEGEKPSHAQHILLHMDKLEELRKELNGQTELHLSLNDVICGWLWYLLSQVRDCEPEEKLDWHFVVVVDYRRFLPSLPADYIGNVALSERVEILSKSKKDFTLLETCIQIRQKVAGAGKLPEMAHRFRWLREQLDNGMILFPNWKPSTPDLLLTNWSRFPFYDFKLSKGMTPLYGGAVPAHYPPGIYAVQALPRSKDLLMVGTFLDTLMERLQSTGETRELFDRVATVVSTFQV